MKNSHTKYAPSTLAKHCHLCRSNGMASHGILIIHFVEEVNIATERRLKEG